MSDRRFIAGRKLPWRRFWCPLGSAIHCGHDGSGYLSDPEARYSANPDCLSIETLLEKHRTIVLCGQPGSGKSTELERVESHFKDSARETNGFVLPLHCRSIADAALLPRLTVEDPHWQSARTAGTPRTLILDGLDEGIIRIPNLLDVLIPLFKSEDLERVNVVLVCRSAEWDRTAGESFLTLWGSDTANAVFELCPLRQADVEMAATASESGGATAFINAVHQNHLVPLARQPIILGILLDEFLKRSDLNLSYSDFYRRAVDRMLDDPDPIRANKLPDHRKPPPLAQRRQFAARVAALFIFSGKGAVNPSPVADDTSDLTLDHISSGSSPGEDEIDCRLFELDSNLAAHVLGSCLFKPISRDGRLGFSHLTFAEYLAATYVKRLPVHELQKLFFVCSGPDAGIVPQLAETAAWLATLNDGFRDNVLEHEPEALLRADMAQLTPDVKRRVIESLMAEAAKLDPGMFRHLPRLTRHISFPGIFDTLRPVINDRAAPQIQRRLALEIAEICDHCEIEEDMWQILERKDDFALRPFIPRSLFRLLKANPTHSADQLLRLVREDIGPDEGDDLRGIALRLLVPGFLNPVEALPHLSPAKNESYIGPYHFFLERDLPEAIEPHHVCAFLKEMAQWQGCFDYGSCFRPVAETVFRLAMENITEPEIASLLARMWLKKAREYEPLPNDRAEREEPSLLKDDRSRRVLVASILDLDEATPDVVLTISFPLMQNDLAWLLEEFRNRPKAKRPVWARAISQLAWNAAEREKCLEDFLAAFDEFEEIRADFPSVSGGNIHETLISLSEKAQRELAERHAEIMKKQPPSLNRRAELTKAFDTYAADHNPTFWVQLCYILHIKKDRRPLASLPSLNITAAPGWSDLTRAEKETAVEAMRQFLLQYSDEREDPNRYSNYANAGYFAIHYLSDQVTDDPMLGERVRDHWLPAITDRFNNGELEHREMIALACQLDRPAVVRAFRRQLETLNAGDRHLVDLRSYEDVWDDEFSAMLASLLTMEATQPQAIRDGLEFLSRKDPSAAPGVLEHFFKKIEEDFTFKPSPAGRAFLASALYFFPDKFWSRAWIEISADRDNAKALILENVNHWEIFMDREPDHLAPSQLADLHFLLRQRELFPPDNDPREVDGCVTNAQMAIELRDKCLRSLAKKGATTELRAIRDDGDGVQQQNVGWYLADATSNRRRETWVPLPPESFLKLTRTKNAALVRTNDDLLDCVLASIDRFEEALKRGQASRLWNEKPFTPKDEETLSNELAEWLRSDLGVIANREPQIVFSRQRTDIKVEARSIDPLDSDDVLTVIIEVKRAHNPNVHDQAQSQLVDRYLNTFTHGVYLIGWYYFPKWHSRSRPGLKAKRIDGAGSETRSIISGLVLRDNQRVEGRLVDCRLS